ncbi:MAG: DUF4389 domain-containing protein [Mariprofundaceae bacterium]
MSEEAMSDDLKEHVKDTNVWVRLLFMLLFAILYWVAEAVLAVVVLFQFLSVLLTGQKNDKVLMFGAQLSTYVYQIFRYLTYNSETRPFPLNDWPSDLELAETKPARKRAPVKKKAPAAKSTRAKKEVKEEKPAASD